MSKTKKLKPGYSFISPAFTLLSRGGTHDDVRALATEYEITADYVENYLKRKTKSVAIVGGVNASREEKDSLYNGLDTKFIEQHPNFVAFRRGENIDFYEYKNGVYISILDRDVYNMVDSIMMQHSLFDYRTSKRKVDDTITRIGALLSRTPKRSFTEESLAGRKWFLNLRNGLLDMETFILLPHSSDYFSTVQVPYDYDPKAVCPMFDNFIVSVSNKTVSTGQMIQEMFGYSLMEGNPKHKVFYLYGDTARNGKSTTAKILCGLIGWGNVSTLSLMQLESENSSILTSIIGKQVNFSDEISSKYIESSRLTAMSSEGVVEINPKYKRSFLYPVKAKFIITCNDLPRFKDSQGMKHRMVSIPFRYHFKEEERINRYDEILLQKEGSGILNWAIEGAKLITKNNVFSINEESKEDAYDNLMQNNSVYAYMDMTYDFDEKFTEEMHPDFMYGEFETSNTPPTGYRLFCKESGIGFASRFTFKRELGRYARETNKMKQVRKGNIRLYTGLIESKKNKPDEFKDFNI